MPVIRIVKQAPLSVCLVWTACILFVGVWSETTPAENGFQSALRQWGASVERVVIRLQNNNHQWEQVSGTSGPMDVWDGEWWRLLVSNLHHGGLFHLMLNATALLICGRILERRMGFWLYLILIVSSAFVVSAVAGLFEENGVGLSGILYAMVGLLFVWRDRDSEVAEEFPFPMVIAAGAWLLICQLLTYFEIWPIGNVAHYTGFIYGWIWGQVYLEEKQKLIFRFLFGAGHLLLIPAFWFVIHPFWNGAWHYHLATREGITERQKIERLQTACLLDPGISIAWWQLSELYDKHNDRQLALRVAMEGLKHNRESSRLLDQTVDLWIEDMRTNEQPIGQTLARQIFADEADVWIQKITRRSDSLLNRLSWEPEQLLELLGQESPSELSVPLLEQLIEKSRQPGSPQPDFQPDVPDSAREGEVF
ncbi:MAG: rhomboid family intramembrane serine protease [Planctomycetaceae bacterium]|nr:rhomboid family intramembrane serine protease [Planctomycetaceae bacterium]